MRRQKDKFRPFKRVSFYCDENFPAPSLVQLKSFKVIHSVIHLNYGGREDEFHYQYAAKLKSVLLTIDDDYLDNRRFRINLTYGVIVLAVGQTPTAIRVDQVISKLTPLLKSFNSQSLKDTKIKATLDGYTKWSLENNEIVKKEVDW